MLYGDLTYPDAEAEMPTERIRHYLPSLRYMMLPMHTLATGSAESNVVEQVSKAGLSLGFLPQFMSIESLSGAAGFNQRIGIEQLEQSYDI